MRNICAKESRCKVLLVEDELCLRQLFERELVESGEWRYRVFYAESLAQMKETCDREGDLEAVILDLELGKTAGLDTLGQALLLTAQKIPIIALAGAYGLELEEGALDMGAQAFCEKTKTAQSALLNMVRLAIAGYRPYLRLLGIIEGLNAELEILRRAESAVDGDALKTFQGVRQRLTALARTT